MWLWSGWQRVLTRPYRRWSSGQVPRRPFTLGVGALRGLCVMPDRTYYISPLLQQCTAAAYVYASDNLCSTHRMRCQLRLGCHAVTPQRVHCVHVDINRTYNAATPNIDHHTGSPYRAVWQQSCGAPAAPKPIFDHPGNIVTPGTYGSCPPSMS